uniref:Predicted nucleic acid-binding protein, contains PIN domain n=1 Tax=Candidatus Kentrum sp. SD TaxID=2126332 RepID=A0A450YDS5_9GAMM|nr:MAG: Predicted nucleic acid-binding protein, contains PIN domain [Candidatus Kentron sp. SD]VFK39625.1 MAG: Predicted nucleic acid-binding protein, contains PIN domain [Candidatus Kentron sp. SD]
MPGERVFLDTNIWVYLSTDPCDAADRRKRDIARQILSDHPNIVASTQVLNELSNVCLKKYHLKVDQVKLCLEKIQEIAEVHLLNEASTFRALDLFGRYGFAFYDSLIIAAALDAGCRTLYTEDLQHAQRIGELIIENPFRETSRLTVDIQRPNGESWPYTKLRINF